MQSPAALAFGARALRSLGGNAAWSGDITINTTNNSDNFANATITASSGSADTFGAIGQTGQTTNGLGVIKLGEGMLVYTGSSANTYAGSTLVAQGGLHLDKTGVNAIAGTLTVGNDAGSQQTQTSFACFSPNQIARYRGQVQVTPSGWLDLNNNVETIGNATLTGLTSSSASRPRPSSPPALARSRSLTVWAFRLRSLAELRMYQFQSRSPVCHHRHSWRHD